MVWGDAMIYYILPEYIDGKGDCCRVKDSEEDRIYEKKIGPVLKKIFSSRCFDLRIIKNKCGRILNQKNLIPLYLGADEILIPVKVREPRLLRDGEYGYVNIFALQNMMDKHILLKDGSKIIFMDSKRCIIKRVKMAKILEECFKENHVRLKDEDGVYDIPATKEDVALILKEILHIKRTMERII